MVHDRPIPWEVHRTWFARALVDGDTRVRIVSYSNVDCGVLTWTREPASVFSFGIYVVPILAPVKRIGSAALALLLRHLFEDEAAVAVRADVLIENERAIRAYSALGFSKVEGSNRVVERSNGSTELQEMALSKEDWAVRRLSTWLELSELGLLSD
jgi:hypothetical protein